MSYELEESILGCLLLNPELVKKTVVSDKYFLDDTNRFILKLFIRQYQEFKTISPVGLVENYKSEFNEKYPASKIIMKITEIASEIAVADNYDYYQESLFNQYRENQILSLINKFHKQEITTNELLDSIHKIEALSIKTDTNHLTAEEIFRIVNSTNKSIHFRLKKLSDTANIQEHDLVVVAARTGIGKSGFCLNLLEDLSDRYNCLYLNMEISEKQIYQRLISINSKIDMKYLDKPETDYQKNAIIESCKKISSKKIKVFTQVQTITNIRRIIISESKKEHTIVFVDHVGLIDSRSNITIYEKLTSIVKELRQISLNYNCTIFLVSQLNRNAADESIPKISELKDSGELEQSATTVILLHDENHEKNMTKDVVDITFIIGKNRNGSLGKTSYSYNKKNQRFD